MKEYPKHSSGFNLPVDLGHDSDDWAPQEFLCVRPFRSSWDASEWGDLDGHPEFKPVSQTVAQKEIENFCARNAVRPGFDLGVSHQTIVYSQKFANEYMSTAILLFGYDRRGLSFQEVAETHFNFTEEQVSLLGEIKKWWVEHPTLGGSLEFVMDGGWGHLSHAWSVGVWVGKNPSICFNPSKGRWIAHQQRS